MVPWSKIHTEDPQILGPTVQNLLIMATWQPAYVYLWFWSISFWMFVDRRGNDRKLVVFLIVRNTAIFLCNNSLSIYIYIYKHTCRYINIHTHIYKYIYIYIYINTLICITWKRMYQHLLCSVVTSFIPVGKHAVLTVSFIVSDEKYKKMYSCVSDCTMIIQW
jgi:hypothetical protein